MPRRSANPSSASGRFLQSLAIVVTAAWVGCGQAKAIKRAEPLPRRAVRLAAFGDGGSGDHRQRAVSVALFAEHERDPVDGVLLLGDNLYVDKEAPPPFAQSVAQAFERPYRELIGAGVAFHAILGNHDVAAGYAVDEANYPPFHMNGARYHSSVFGGGLVEVFFLDYGPLKDPGDPEQAAWLDAALAASLATWKVVALHQSPVSTSLSHGMEPRLRSTLAPIFKRRGVALVLAGHSHVYERIGPIDGTTYITAGSGGKLRRGDLDPDDDRRAAGYDDEPAFATFDFGESSCAARAINDRGEIVDEAALAPVG